ncbi:MAG: 50S ribosomal protein L23 [Candidatus Paceibacterota bacterium]
MAIFGFKKRKDEKLEQSASAAKGLPNKSVKKTSSKAVTEKSPVKAVGTKIVSPVVGAGSSSHAASVIIRPRVTEKSGLLSQNGVYTFEVTKNASKTSIAKAFQALYKFHPAKIAVINTPIKNVFVKGRRGTVAGMRKAVISLKAGEKIDFV